MEYDKMLKAELQAECEKRGLESVGLKDELVARLEANDAESPVKEVKAAKADGKKRVWNPMLFRYELK
jgi:hypothetical protein